MKKYLIIGCGLSGIIIARLLTNIGNTCYIIDERNHIGGNCYTEKYYDTNIHVYGAHIFHTSNKEIWNFVNKYDEFIPYHHVVKCITKDNNIYDLPFNMNTFKEVFNVKTIESAKEKLDNEIKEYHVEKPRNLEEQAINLVGKTIYELLIKEYTEKQWNKSCKELSPEIIKRLPLRFSWNSNYFNDTYQGIPEHGYTQWLLNILNGVKDETSIKYDLETKFNLNNIDEYLNEYDYIIYTGQVDKLLDYELGILEWRSLKFIHQELLNTIENDQGCSVINYTSHNQSYTRIIDHYYFNHIQNDYSNKTKILTYEFPQDYDKTKIAYYPVNNIKNNKLYNDYINLLKEKYPNIILAGRLGLYKYFDMDDAIENSFNLVNNIK